MSLLSWIKSKFTKKEPPLGEVVTLKTPLTQSPTVVSDASVAGPCHTPEECQKSCHEIYATSAALAAETLPPPLDEAVTAEKEIQAEESFTLEMEMEIPQKKAVAKKKKKKKVLKPKKGKSKAS